MNPFSIASWFGSNNINKRHNKRVMGKIWVAGKHTTLGVGGPGKELSWGETRSGGTGGSHPGLIRTTGGGAGGGKNSCDRTKALKE